jgi:hypothetical protein
MSKVIFLDFDGVIVHSKYVQGMTDKTVNVADPKCMARLRKIILATGAKVTVHSTWAYVDPPDVIRRLLDAGGVTEKHLHKDFLCTSGDKFDYFSKEIAIQLFLNNHPDITQYAILEDSRLVWPIENESNPGHHLVHISNGWYMGGIQDKHVEEAIQLLT